MINFLYEWMRGIAYYMVLITAIIQVAAAESYRKYIRLFTGIILVLMILAPVIQVFGLTEKEVWTWEEEYEKTAQKIEERVKEMEQEIEAGTAEKDGAENPEDPMADSGKAAGIEEEKEAGRIKVEEIHIGR